MDYDVPLLAAIERGGSVRTFRFERPEGLDFRAGQYFLLRLDDRLVKPFSFSSSPSEEGYFEFTTRLSGSEFKTALSRLKTKDRVHVIGPNGKFTLNEAHSRVVFLAGGIGVTPFRSMCKWAADMSLDCDIALLWGVNSIEDAFFRDDFESMKAINPRLRTLYVPSKPPDNWTGPSGVIRLDILREHVPDYNQRVFYVCGPPKMVEAVGRMLAEANVTPDRLIKEQFG